MTELTTYGPYSPVRKADNLLFVSGQVGVDPITKNASSDIAAQTEQALRNMEDVLHSAEATLQDVVKTTIFLTDMDDFEAINAVYEKVFSTPRPARSTVCVRELPRVGGNVPIRVEIEAVACKELS
ncbi:MAG TPA: RidA family protein [Candidatus Saccharimonadales bacterium]|nr:RidA family protein [Candidatus Saccharimonadales bacterium]